MAIRVVETEVELCMVVLEVHSVVHVLSVLSDLVAADARVRVINHGNHANAQVSQDQHS